MESRNDNIIDDDNSSYYLYQVPGKSPSTIPEDHTYIEKIVQGMISPRGELPSHDQLKSKQVQSKTSMAT